MVDDREVPHRMFRRNAQVEALYVWRSENVESLMDVIIVTSTKSASWNGTETLPSVNFPQMHSRADG